MLGAGLPPVELLRFARVLLLGFLLFAVWFEMRIVLSNCP